MKVGFTRDELRIIRYALEWRLDYIQHMYLRPSQQPSYSFIVRDFNSLKALINTIDALLENDGE